jgi:hypothetical protein
VTVAGDEHQMDMPMITFLAIGFLGIALLVLVAVVDGILDFFDGDGLLSGPAIASFLSAFGFGGAIASYAGLGSVPSLLVGVGAGLGLGLVVGKLTGALLRMPTDATPSASDMTGLHGTVISSIPVDGFGEVSLLLGGQPVKVAGRTGDATALSAGTQVTVVTPISPTSVIVTATTPTPTVATKEQP